jgi:uncharacterized protein (TIGR03000 family)
MRKLVWIVALSALALFCSADLASARGCHGGRGGCGGGGCGGCGGYSGCGGCGYGGGCGSGGCGYGGCGYGGGCYAGGCGYGGCSYGGGYGGGGYCSSCYAYDGGTPYTGVALAPAAAEAATLIVSLPADAHLSVDDYKTTSTSGERVFSTPALKVGQDFHYTLTAEVNRGGKIEKVTRDVTVRAGQTTRVSLDLGTQVASAK